MQAQLLPARQYDAVMELFDTAGRMEGAPLAPPAADAAPPEQLDPGRDMPVDISILGPISVRAPGVLEPDLVGLVTEVVVFLAMHSGGVHRNAVEAAIWPRGTDSEALDAALAAARDWLGTDGIGRPHLAEDAAGGCRLGSGVRVDWHVFRALAGQRRAGPAGQRGRGRLPGPGPRPGARAACSTGARPGGTPGWPPATWSTRPPPRWLTRRTGWPRSGWPRATPRARWTRPGPGCAWPSTMSCSGGTCSAPRRRPASRTWSAPWSDELCARTALDEVLPQMAPETEALIDEILPSWRSAAY